MGGSGRLDEEGNLAVPRKKRTNAEIEADRQAARDELREDAVSKVHEIKSSRIWKQYPKEWLEATEHERRDMLCGIIFFDGIMLNKRGLSLIANLFKIKVSDLDPYLEDMRVADAARVLKITHNQFQFFLLNDHQPMGKFFIGKQFAYQVGDPAHEGVDSVQDRPARITIVEEKADENDPERKAMVDALDQRVRNATVLALVPKKTE